MKNISKAGGVAEVVECLPSKCEALSSSTSITRKEERKDRKKEGREGRRKGGRKKDNSTVCFSSWSQGIKWLYMYKTSFFHLFFHHPFILC
jgi:hypothetical protein